MSFSEIKIKLFIGVQAIMISLVIAICITIPCQTESNNLFERTGSFGIFSLGFSMIFFVINGWFTGKQFDKTWKDKLLHNKFARTIYWDLLFSNNYPLHSRMRRAGIYAVNIVQKNKTKKNIASRHIFEGYDFRGNARLVDKIFSFAFVYSLYLFILSLGAMLAIKVIDYFL